MNDFEQRRMEMQRARTRQQRFVIYPIMALAGICLLSAGAAGAYMLLKPEALGQYLARVVRGYEHSR